MNQLSDWKGEDTDKWLTPSLEDLIISGTSKSWAVKWVSWKWDGELHCGVQGWVWSSLDWLSLNVLDSWSIWWNQTLDVELDKGFLNWKNTW